MSGTVWMVTSGEYSDYSVSCVCATKADAEEVADRLNRSEVRHAYMRYRVEDVPLVTPGDVRVHIALHVIFRDGETHEWTLTHTEFGDEGSRPESFAYELGESHVHVWGTDHGRVRKVFSERVARMIADREGLT